MQNEPFGPSLEPSAVRTLVFRRRGKAFCGGRLVAPSYRGELRRGADEWIAAVSTTPIKGMGGLVGRPPVRFCSYRFVS
jgi:hypothetical protein